MLSVERFAELRAAMERAADRDAVLRQAGLTPRAWIQLQRHWLNALAAEVTKGRDDLAARYRGAFDRASGTTPTSATTATSTAPAVAILGAAAASPAASVAHDAPPPPTAPSGHLPYMPSYLVGVPRDPGAGAPPAPIATPSPPVAPAFPAPAVALPAASSLGGTSLALNIPRGPALPFPGSANAAAPASSAAPSPAPAPPHAPAPPAGPGTGTALDISAAVAAAKKKKNPTTPFKRPPGADAAAPPPSPSASAPALTPASNAPASPPAGGAAPEPPVPELTIEQYAWLVAALRHATAPGDAERVLAQLRLPPEAQRPLQERWRARMAADPALQAQFFAALQRQVKARGG